jgi:hypothetical protein
MTNEEFKKTLWDAANKLRGAVSAAEYKYPPDKQVEATEKVLTQAELLADTWAKE